MSANIDFDTFCFSHKSGGTFLIGCQRVSEMGQQDSKTIGMRKEFSSLLFKACNWSVIAYSDT